MFTFFVVVRDLVNNLRDVLPHLDNVRVGRLADDGFVSRTQVGEKEGELLRTHCDGQGAAATCSGKKLMLPKLY